MKVNVEREVDLNWLIEQLDAKSQINYNGMAGLEVRVDKQLLRDAHDVIVEFVKFNDKLYDKLFEKALNDYRRAIKVK